jgi:hypothetical protein
LYRLYESIPIISLNIYNMAEKLLESLDDDPSMEERELMDMFIRQFSKRYEFRDTKYRNLLEKIVNQRLEIE